MFVKPVQLWQRIFINQHNIGCVDQKINCQAAMTRMSVLKEYFKNRRVSKQFFKRITRAYPISRLMKKTFTSRNKIVTIVLFGNM